MLTPEAVGEARSKPGGIRFLGGKRRLANWIAQHVVEAAPDANLAVDLFSGSGAVTLALRRVLPVIANDVEAFAYTLGAGYYCAPADDQVRIPSAFMRDFAVNRRALEARFSEALREEATLLKSKDAKRLRAFRASFPRLTIPFERNGYSEAFLRSFSSTTLRRYRARPRSRPYRLVSTYYGTAYFSLRQAIDLDSLRYAIDQAPPSCHAALLSVLARTAIQIASAPGHFAQFFSLTNESTTKRVIAQQVRDALAVFRVNASASVPTGLKPAVAMNGRAEDLLHALRPDCRFVLYADPPYTKDHYSRFYHLLNTLVLYDYPEVSGGGIYRANRFTSDFSVKTRVRSAFDSLFSSASRAQAPIVVSYSDRGLMPVRGVRELARRHYANVRLRSRRLSHSGQGAPSGSVSRREYLLLCTEPSGG